MKASPYRSTLGALGVLLLVPALAVAQARPDARQMSCPQVQDIIAASGAVVLTTGTHTYDRYVSNGLQCSMGESLAREYITTGDGNRCLVYKCQFFGD
jgi:hypothetical protein